MPKKRRASRRSVLTEWERRVIAAPPVLDDLGDPRLREVIERYRATRPAERAERLRGARRRMESSYLWDDLWSRIKREVPL